MLIIETNKLSLNDLSALTIVSTTSFEKSFIVRFLKPGESRPSFVD